MPISEYTKGAMDIERRIKKVKVKGLKTPCWLWEGSVRSDDQKPVMQRGGRKVSVSKYLWEKEHGPVPDGRLLKGKCPNEKMCINPALEHRGL